MLIFSVFSKDVSNTIGNVPVEWYNEYPHIGYDLHGEKILKPATGDEVSSCSYDITITTCLKLNYSHYC